MKPTPSPNTHFPAGRASVAGIALVLSMLAGCAQDAADHVDADDVRQAAADVSGPPGNRTAIAELGGVADPPDGDDPDPGNPPATPQDDA